MLVTMLLSFFVVSTFWLLLVVLKQREIIHKLKGDIDFYCLHFDKHLDAEVDNIIKKLEKETSVE